MQEGELDSIPTPVREAYAKGKLAIFVGSGQLMASSTAAFAPSSERHFVLWHSKDGSQGRTA